MGYRMNMPPSYADTLALPKQEEMPVQQGRRTFSLPVLRSYESCHRRLLSKP